MTRTTIMLALFTAAGCASGAAGSGSTAMADIRNAEGESVAVATLTERGGAVIVTVHATALPPGVHGIHLHETGTCTPPDFTSAGGHFNPASTQHGFDNPEGPHAGDLRNFEVQEDGTGHFMGTNERVTLSEGPTSLFDADGTAIVIHAGPDDYRTDPAGDSGARIACGVVMR